MDVLEINTCSLLQCECGNKDNVGKFGLRKPNNHILSTNVINIKAKHNTRKPWLLYSRLTAITTPRTEATHISKHAWVHGRDHTHASNHVENSMAVDSDQPRFWLGSVSSTNKSPASLVMDHWSRGPLNAQPLTRDILWTQIKQGIYVTRIKLMKWRIY